MSGTVGLALGGGGAKGDFQVGALKYLYEQHGVRPDVICGTSVGALNGVKLAEGEDDADPQRGFRGLERIWLDDLTSDLSMFREEEWLGRIDPSLRSMLVGYLVGPAVGAADNPPPPSHDDDDDGDLGAAVVSSVESLLSFVPGVVMAALECAAAQTALQEFSHAKSVFNLGPIRDLLATRLRPGDVADWSAGGRRKLRLATVSLDSGALRYVTESGGLIERDGATPVTAVAGPCDGLAEEVAALEAELHTLEEDMIGATSEGRKATVAEMRPLRLELGRKRAALNSCRIEHADDPRLPGPPVTVSLLQGVLASASVGGINNPPVDLAGEMYTDGGFRETIPVEAAVRAGARTVYAIGLSPRDPGNAGPFRDKHLLDFVARGLTGLALNEVELNDAVPFTGWHSPDGGGDPEVVLIQPEFELHGSFTIDPGLIRISMAYGYMKAADVVEGKPRELHKLAERIVRKRASIWLREERIGKVARGEAKHGEIVEMLTPEQVRELRAIKRELRALIDERASAGGALPHDSHSWWADWERHQQPPIADTPWGVVPTQFGDVPAEDPDQPAPPPPPEPADRHGLRPGEELAVNQTRVSPDGQFTLIMQGDGNLVLYGPSGALWATGTDGHRPGKAVMAATGDLSVEDVGGNPLWSSGTYGHDYAWLAVQDDGRLVIDSTDGVELWASSPPPRPAPAPSTHGDRLEAGDQLTVDSSIQSADGRFTLIMQGDGNLVLYGPSGPLWASQTDNQPGILAVMQGDGNLVVYTNDGRALWASGTDGHAGAQLVLQDDGNLVLYAPSGDALWASNTVVSPPPPAHPNQLAPGEQLAVDGSIQSPDGRFTLVMQGDGNLVLYGPSGPLWASGTDHQPGVVAIMQGDGNFVVYTQDGRGLWASGTDGHPGASVVLDDQGRLAVVDQSGATLWAAPVAVG